MKLVGGLNFNSKKSSPKIEEIDFFIYSDKIVT